MTGLRAVIFDWAGTVVDYGSRAPAAAFVELFRRRGLQVTEAEARGPMGTPKRDHISALLSLPRIAEEWTAAFGAPPAEPDIDALYTEFTPLQREIIALHSDIIPGAIETAQALVQSGIAIGSTTGYARAMMVDLIASCAARGFTPASICCADDVPAGRPAPWMALRSAQELNAWPMAACVKVGDTPADIAEGLNAGMWTVGITRTGNELGLAQAEVDALDPIDRRQRLDRAAQRLTACGAHLVIESVAELPGALGQLRARLRQGERP